MRRGVLALVCSAVVALAGCGGRTATGNGEAAAGPPQRGGSVVALQMTEPRSLDPAVMSNAYAGNGVVGNALYGILINTDPATGEVVPGLAEDLTSSDGGASWTLSLREGLKFSDGTPLDATAVKFNWERIKDPGLGSASLRIAALMSTVTVADARTLTVTLATPLASFPDSVASSSLNWIAAPAALQAGQQAFDAAPIGAGPFILESWRRQDRMTLVRNPSYYDPERPYLDSLTLRTSTDENQRLGTLTSGAGDLMISSNAQIQARAEQAGFTATRHQQNGGIGVLFNTASTPFDDPRAREAVAKAIDLDAVNAAVFGGKGEVATTLFRPDAPLFTDIPLTTHDQARAQTLLNELAAGGKPLEFTITAHPTIDSRVRAEAIQAQLSQYANVRAHVEVLDFAGVSAKMLRRQFQAVIGSPGNFVDPGFALWNTLHSTGSGNYTGIRDAELDAALDAGRTATDTAQRRAAYETVQRRLTALTPFLLTNRDNATILADEKIHGVELYGAGSLLTDGLWTEDAAS